jgi:hypothetical protein
MHDYYKSCDACQRIGGLANQNLEKLVTIFKMNHLWNGDLILWGQLSQHANIQETNTFL